MSLELSREALLAELAPADRGVDRVLCLGHAMKEVMGPRLSRTAMELGVRLAGGKVTDSLCVSDGGDGFLEVCQQLLGGSVSEMVVRGPLGRMAVTPMLVDSNKATGAIETAKVCGLAMVPAAERDVVHSGTGALGEQINRMVSLGIREIHVGLGGSATCDGGLGMLMRLREGLLGVPQGKAHVSAADLADGLFPDVAAIRARLQDLRVAIHVYADVQVPLLGETGSARFFAPQKGASPEDVEALENVMGRWATEVEHQVGLPLRDLAGAGAAGGLGFAFAALGYTPGDGVAKIFGQLRLRQKLAACDMLVTCEGIFDRTSLAGKAPWKAALLAREAGRGATIICGLSEPDAVAEATARGIRVVEFGRGIPEGRRGAESFTRLSDTVRRVLTGLA